jgi:hypothetical protein
MTPLLRGPKRTQGAIMFRRNLIPVWIGIILLSGLFLMGQTSECPWGFQVVDFSVPALEQAVRDRIRKPAGEICSSDLLRLWYLLAGGLDISNINGLEYCTNLTTLGLAGNQISDLRPLSGLGNLESLLVETNQISDLTQLSGLVSLETLSVPLNQISDIGPLSGLANLWILYLDSNQISDLSPLVLNPGIDGGYVDVTGNPLSPASCTVHIPTLEARGVFVDHDCP